MKQLLNELKMSGLTLKEKAISWYFVISLCMTGSLVAVDASNPALFIILALFLLNFWNAALLMRKVKTPKTN